MVRNPLVYAEELQAGVWSRPADTTMFMPPQAYPAGGPQYFARRVVSPAPETPPPVRQAGGPVYATRSPRTIEAGKLVPVLLEGGLYYARTLIKVPYRMFNVKVLTDAAYVHIPYAIVDEAMIPESSKFGSPWYDIVSHDKISDLGLVMTSVRESGWMFIDARNGAAFNSVRTNEETGALELLVNGPIDPNYTQWGEQH